MQELTVVMVSAGGRGAFLWGGESGSRGVGEICVANLLLYFFNRCVLYFNFNL